MRRLQAVIAFLAFLQVVHGQADGGEDLKLYHLRVLIAHASLMAFVWLFAVPFGVIIARYSPRWDHGWFPKHMGGMIVAAAVPLIIAFALGVRLVGHAEFTDPHHIIGLTVFVGFWVQGKEYTVFTFNACMLNSVFSIDRYFESYRQP
ncbi:hypothetical protein BZG36_01249 [Bifiguratus adelaidae]|uniref:Cytochrome b561 domain-containing protein n=1 Tax=Bifiguratus adelaidae TaxID=1938954 RepID=A0A261Y5T7_9FUNG|nr:hypothetical protein BZG36_01249 [Bifiguratus adelaidae]